ncbi:helix-turn-helix domain-containing protein [Candidatus Poribacteria bacterium]|nr:helix-turn-helix domain-containing protein [Candidatus Poribacteria bacterium]
MAASALGVLLRYLREERRFSLRELAQFAEVDHAYVYRLETGEKESPSDEVLARLVKVLKPDTRHVEMLRFLAKNPGLDPALTEYAMKEPSVIFDEFMPAATMRHRGNIRPDPKTLIERVRKFLKE